VKKKGHVVNRLVVIPQGKKLPANIDGDAEEGDVSDEDSEEEEDEDDTQINTDVRTLLPFS
jgi:hypothetical protein